MSVRTFATPAGARPEPVVIDSVWEYGSGYHRTGRVWVKQKIRADFWECVETVKGEARNYFTDDLLQNASLTKIQPGQNWISASVLAVNKIVRPEIANSATYRAWFVERDGKPVDFSVYEDTILNFWTLVEHVTPSGKKTELCPLCGAPGLAMAVLFDCSAPACRNYRDNNRRGKGTP